MATNKKVLMAIMAAKPKPESDGEEAEGGKAEGDEYDVAAQDVLDAVHDDDAKALATALKSYVDMCMAKGEG